MATAPIPWRICGAFWMFGLTNNIFFVIVLTAALDLVGPAIPKATVLLATIIPSLAAKLVTPYVLHLIPYDVRILLLAALSTAGILAIALSPTDIADPVSIASKLSGIVLGSVASGLGEVHFLSIVHYYGSWSLATWGSGTGGAGLAGAGLYSLATIAFGWSVQATLLASNVFPMMMLLSYFMLLPRDVLRTAAKDQMSKRGRHGGYARIHSNESGDLEDDGKEDDSGTSRRPDSGGRETAVISSAARSLEAARDQPPVESAALLATAASPPFSAYAHHPSPSLSRAWTHFRHQLRSTRNLVYPYMLPLFLVYLGEYTINQGVAPTLLFPLYPLSPFGAYRDFYPVYGTIYQLGVFISRSSLPFVRIRQLYAPTLLQLLNLAILIAQAMAFFLPSVYLVFAIILWEGLLGGLVYVSAFAAIREEVPSDEREFCLGVAAMADSFGILAAGLIGAGLETGLCERQVASGRDWCTRL